MSGAVILAFLKGNWRYIAIVLAVLAIVGGGYAYVHKLERDAFNRGVQQEDAKLAKQIAQENARNRAEEQRLQSALDGYAKKVAVQQQELNTKEVVYRDRVVTIASKDPTQNCPTNPDITAARNAIRGSLK